MITHYTGYPGSGKVYAHDDEGSGYALVVPFQLCRDLHIPFSWGIQSAGGRALAMALALDHFPDDPETAYEVHDHIMTAVVLNLPHGQKFRLEASEVEEVIMRALDAWGPFSTTHPTQNPAREQPEDICPDAKFPWADQP